MSDGLQVIFGTGPLGMATMRALHRRGKRIRVVNRSGKHPAGLPGEVEVFAGDVFKTDFTTTITQGAAVVYQCAQPTYIVSARTADDFLHTGWAGAEILCAWEAEDADRRSVHPRGQGDVRDDL